MATKKGPTRKTASRPSRPKARARPSAKPAVEQAPEKPDRAREVALSLAQLALEKKALDVVVLDVRGLSSYAEYLVIMTAESDPQMTAIADHLEESMKERGERALGTEGAQAGQWVLIDFIDVVAHVFYKDARDFYDLEHLWADAPKFAVRD